VTQPVTPCTVSPSDAALAADAFTLPKRRGRPPKTAFAASKVVTKTSPSPQQVSPVSPPTHSYATRARARALLSLTLMRNLF
jgi:hypothetical protein